MYKKNPRSNKTFFLLIVSTEGDEVVTEKEFFLKLIDGNDNIIFRSIDNCKQGAKELLDRSKHKLDPIIDEINNGGYESIEIIVCSDGDTFVSPGQYKSYENTYNLLKQYLEKHISIDIEHIEYYFDMYYSFEFFLWIMGEYFDEEYFIENIDDHKLIKAKVDESINHLCCYKISSILFW